MHKFQLLIITLAIALASCTASQFATYRPAGSSDSNWEINVKHTSGVTQNFKVVINDSTVIDASANFFTGRLERKSEYRGENIKLIVTYSSGFLGFGAGFESMVLINNELAGKFKF